MKAAILSGVLWRLLLCLLWGMGRGQEAALRFRISGDIMLGTFVLPQEMREKVLTLKPYIEGGDIRFGNIEGNFITGKEKPSKCSEASRQKGICYEFGMPVQNADLLAQLGYSLLHMDNNHTEDYGIEGYNTTKALITKLGITPLGKKETQIIEVRGLKVGFIPFGFSGRSYQVGDIPAAVSLVKALRPKVDILVVSFHGGAEGPQCIHTPNHVEMFYGENRGNVRAFAHAVIDAGADLVIGHGPHVLRGMERYKDRLILYSLGNFIVINGINISGPNGLTAVFEVDLDRDGKFLRGKVWPMRIIGGVPTLDPKKESLFLLRRLTEEDFQGGGLHIKDDGEVVPLLSIAR
ncbi:MAG: CapA family protein [Bacteroidia bacterium]|nr:CapA family protein [Bacteroidia bacterium]MDW8134105.1 CapA family protein [Bacteroidia bacterium]